MLLYVGRKKMAPAAGSFLPQLAGLPGVRGRGKILTEKNLADYTHNRASFSFAGRSAETADPMALATTKQPANAGAIPAMATDESATGNRDTFDLEDPSILFSQPRKYTDEQQECMRKAGLPVKHRLVWRDCATGPPTKWQRYGNSMPMTTCAGRLRGRVKKDDLIASVFANDFFRSTTTTKDAFGCHARRVPG
ncbi:MAG: hypothetical protein WCZ02_08140 [Lysobacterales bacterium]